MLRTDNRADGMSVRRIGGDHHDHHHPKAIDGRSSTSMAPRSGVRATAASEADGDQRQRDRTDVLAFWPILIPLWILKRIF